MTLKSSLRRVIAVEPDRKIVEKFAIQAYKEHFVNKPIQSGTWRGYESFEIISDKKIRIKYAFGAADMGYFEHFDVSI